MSDTPNPVTDNAEAQLPPVTKIEPLAKKQTGFASGRMKRGRYIGISFVTLLMLFIPIVNILGILWFISSSVKRCHDVGYSGKVVAWFMCPFYVLVPIKAALSNPTLMQECIRQGEGAYRVMANVMAIVGVLAFVFSITTVVLTLILWVKGSQKEDNKYGPASTC